MNDLYLHKLSDNEYAIFGKVNMFREIYKEVEVDGEIYTKTIKEDFICDMEDEFRNKRLSKFETHFLHALGMPEITLHYYEFYFSNTINKLLKIVGSSNDYVNFLMLLSENKLLPDCFKDVDFSKDSSVHCYDIPKYEFIMYRYGYGCIVAADIQYQYIVKHNIQKKYIESNLRRLIGNDEITDNLLLDKYPIKESDKIKQIQYYLKKVNIFYKIKKSNHATSKHKINV
jgi:hypothetical protein